MVLMQMTDQSIIAVVMKVFHIHNVYSRIQNISTCQSFERNSLLLQFSTQSFSRKIARMVLQTFQLHFTVTFHCSNGSGVALVQPSRMNFPSCISPIVEGGGGGYGHMPLCHRMYYHCSYLSMIVDLHTELLNFFLLKTKLIESDI